MSTYREDHDLDRDLPAPEGDGSPGGIVSFPASVQNRLAQARELLDRNRPHDAAAMLQQAGAELARSSPELFALLAAAPLGVRRLVVEQTETETQTVEKGRYSLGVRVGRDVTTTTTRKTVNCTIRLE